MNRREFIAGLGGVGLLLDMVSLSSSAADSPTSRSSAFN